MIDASCALVALLPRNVSAEIVAGFAPAIDDVARMAPTSHQFLRRNWYEAAVGKSRQRTSTLVLNTPDATPLMALPMVSIGPDWAGIRALPGSYWPFRSFPFDPNMHDDELAVALQKLACDVRFVRIGPIYENDPAVLRLRKVAEVSGWTMISRRIATSFLFDIHAVRAEGPWPRGSTLLKNRYHEKHLGKQGELDWRFVTGADWTAAIFDDLASIEKRSWLATQIKGADAKFTEDGHGALWRATVKDPEIAAAMWAAILYIDGRPCAFCFDIHAGHIKYAVATSYDSAFAKHSPGKLLYYRNLVRGIEDGISLVDWGAGDNGYKATVGARVGPEIMDYVFVSPGFAALGARVMGRFWR